MMIHKQPQVYFIGEGMDYQNVNHEEKLIGDRYVKFIGVSKLAHWQGTKIKHAGKIKEKNA